MRSSRRKLFVTTALPYANGLFHIGHIMEYIQADVGAFPADAGARNALRLRRRRARRGDHAEGKPRGSRRSSWWRAWPLPGRKHLRGFHISFDHWHSTDSQENVELSQDIYRKLKAAGLV